MVKLSQYLFLPKKQWIRLFSLGIFCAPILAAFFYNQGYTISFIACPFSHLTGIPTPTCGLTRSFMAMARGDWHQAFAEHLFGPVLFVGCLLAILHLVLELAKNKPLDAFYLQLLKQKKFQLTGLVMFLGYYTFRLYSLANAGELQIAFLNSPLGRTMFHHVAL